MNKMNKLHKYTLYLYSLNEREGTPSPLQSGRLLLRAGSDTAFGFRRDGDKTGVVQNQNPKTQKRLVVPRYAAPRQQTAPLFHKDLSVK